MHKFATFDYYGCVTWICLCFVRAAMHTGVRARWH